MSTILDRVVIFAPSLSLVSPERDTGQRGGDEFLVEKTSLLFIDKTLLKPLNSMRNEMQKIMRSMGVRMDILNAYAVPMECADDIRNQLESFGSRFDSMKAVFLDDYVRGIEDRLDRATPVQASEIRRIAPSVKTMEKIISFGFAEYRVTGGSGNIDEHMESLPEQVMSDIRNMISESTKPGSRYTQRIRNVLNRVSKKAAGFSFLHPVIAGLPEVIGAVMEKIPGDGAITGTDALIVGALLGALSNKDILDNGISQSNIEYIPEPEPEMNHETGLVLAQEPILEIEPESVDVDKGDDDDASAPLNVFVPPVRSQPEPLQDFSF